MSKNVDSEMNLANNMTGLRMAVDSAMRGDREAAEALVALEHELTCAGAAAGLYALRGLAGEAGEADLACSAAVSSLYEMLKHGGADYLHDCASIIHAKRWRIDTDAPEAILRVEAVKYLHTCAEAIHKNMRQISEWRLKRLEREESEKKPRRQREGDGEGS
jgi:NAD(P)-dependent dehydrogenase (short-subunit alcohol dehydrogenase family)